MNDIMNTHHEHQAQDKKLTIGTPVTVRWGYGLSFRAEGIGKIVKVFEKSVQVQLDNDVFHNGKVGWPAGFVLKGIPRYGMFNDKWNYWHSATPIEQPAPVLPSRYNLIDEV